MKIRVEILSYSKRWEFDYPGIQHPVIFLCPVCNEIWARIAQETFAQTTLREVSCEKCPVSLSYPHFLQCVPGSILWRWGTGWVAEATPDETLFRSLPRELALRELRLHFKAQIYEEIPLDYLTSNTTWHLPRDSEGNFHNSTRSADRPSNNVRVESSPRS